MIVTELFSRLSSHNGPTRRENQLVPSIYLCCHRRLKTIKNSGFLRVRSVRIVALYIRNNLHRRVLESSKTLTGLYVKLLRKFLHKIFTGFQHCEGDCIRNNDALPRHKPTCYLIRYNQTIRQKSRVEHYRIRDWR